MTKGSSSEVKLLGAWPSPFTMRARIAFNIKRVDYEFAEETFGTKSQLLLQSNPIHKKMPVLIHKDNPICESLIIVEYIDEVWSSAENFILPSQPHDRAVARFWAAYLDEKWFPTLRCIMRGTNEEERKVHIEQLEEGLGLLNDAYNKISKGKPFFGGDRIGFLDIAFGSFLGWFRLTEKCLGLNWLDHTKTPGLAQWAEKFCEDDSVKHVMQDLEKLHEFAKILFRPDWPYLPVKPSNGILTNE